jgi:hypothetical protein
MLGDIGAIKGFISSKAPDTANFIILRNYEMKDEIYCFVIFTIAIYGRSYIITARNMDIVEPLSSQTKINVSFGTKGIVWPDQYLSFQTKIVTIIYFIRDEGDCTIANVRPIMI